MEPSRSPAQLSNTLASSLTGGGMPRSAMQSISNGAQPAGRNVIGVLPRDARRNNPSQSLSLYQGQQPFVQTPYGTDSSFPHYTSKHQCNTIQQDSSIAVGRVTSTLETELTYFRARPYFMTRSKTPLPTKLLRRSIGLATPAWSLSQSHQQARRSRHTAYLR